MVDVFYVGELYSHEAIYRSLGVGNAGGVRFKINDDGSTCRGVLFTSVPESRLVSENPYHDRIENGVLVYTAQGKKGDQEFGGQNQRLLTHSNTLYPIYCFQLICSRRNKTVGVKRWRFLGFLSGIRQYKEFQVDTQGSLRESCIFEFAVLDDFKSVVPQMDGKMAAAIYAEYISANNKPFQEDEEVETVQDPVKHEDAREIESIRSKMLSLHPSDFEHLIKNVLSSSGFEKVCTTRYSQDGGIDVDAYAGENLWALKGTHLQVQAKRWMHTVGRKEVAELRGSLGLYARGMIVTTSQFSKSAMKEASESGKLPIVMLDGYDFSKVVKHMKLSL